MDRLGIHKYVCDVHGDCNYFVGSCIACTYAEMRRFEQLYHAAVDILRALPKAGAVEHEGLRRAQAFIWGYEKGLHRA